MPRGAYTAKQDRKADHIEESYEKRGVSKKEAEERAWATVNKQDKGGKNDGSGRSPQPQRRRQEGLGNPPPPRQGLDGLSRVRGFRSRARSRAARCARAARACSASAEPARGRLASWLAARLGQAQREPAAVVGILACARPGRRGPGVSTERLTAGAPRPTAAATWLRVAGSLRADRRRAACGGRARRARPGRRRPNSARPR